MLLELTLLFICVQLVADEIRNDFKFELEQKNKPKKHDRYWWMELFVNATIVLLIILLLAIDISPVVPKELLLPFEITFILLLLASDYIRKKRRCDG